MTEESLYDGTIEDAILETIKNHTEQELSSFLVDEPTYEIAMSKTTRDEFMDLGDGAYDYVGTNPLKMLASVASIVHESTKQREKFMLRATVLQRLHLNDMKHPLSILYEGAILEERRMIFSTISVGTIFDYSIDRGIEIYIEDNEAETKRPTKSTDADEIEYSGPLTTLLEIEVSKPNSMILELLNQLPWKSKYKVQGHISKKQYSVIGGPIFEIIPRQGKTIASVRTSAFKEETLGMSNCEIYRMDWGLKEPTNFEVSVPHLMHILVIAKLLKRFENLPEYILSSQPNTANTSGGVAAVLAYEIASEIYYPGKSPPSLSDILSKEKNVREIHGRMNTEHKKARLDYHRRFPFYRIK